MDPAAKEVIKRVAWAMVGTIYFIAVVVTVILTKLLTLIGATIYAALPHIGGTSDGKVDPWPGQFSTGAAVVVAVLGVFGGVLLLLLRWVSLRKSGKQ